MWRKITTLLLVGLLASGCSVFAGEPESEMADYEWTSARLLDPDEPELLVTVFDFETCEASVKESSTTVAIRIQCEESSKCDGCGSIVEKIPLRAPLGSRQVIDAASDTPQKVCTPPKLDFDTEANMCVPLQSPGVL